MFQMLSLVEIGWLVVSFISLLFGGYFDWKDRIIPDKIWLFQLIGAIVLLVLWYLNSPPSVLIVLVGINILMGILFSLVLILTAVMALGDVKALFCLSLSYPLLVYGIDPILKMPDIFPSFFSIILNFFFLYILLSLGFFTFNFIQIIRRRDLFHGVQGSLYLQIRVMFDSINVSTDRLPDLKFYNPAEIYTEGAWRLDTPNFDGMMTDEEFEELERQEKAEMFEGIKTTGKERIWIRPQIPGVSVLLLTFLITISVGTVLGPLFTSITSFL